MTVVSVMTAGGVKNVRPLALFYEVNSIVAKATEKNNDPSENRWNIRRRFLEMLEDRRLQPEPGIQRSIS